MFRTFSIFFSSIADLTDISFLSTCSISIVHVSRSSSSLLQSCFLVFYQLQKALIFYSPNFLFTCTIFSISVFCFFFSIIPCFLALYKLQKALLLFLHIFSHSVCSLKRLQLLSYFEFNFQDSPCQAFAFPLSSPLSLFQEFLWPQPLALRYSFVYISRHPENPFLRLVSQTPIPQRSAPSSFKSIIQLCS